MRMLLRRSEIYQKCIISSRPSPPSRWPWYRQNGSCWQPGASGHWLTDSWKLTRLQTLRKISPTPRNTSAPSRHFAWENSKAQAFQWRGCMWRLLSTANPFPSLFFLNMGHPRPLFGLLLQSFLQTQLTDVLTINWAYPRLVDEACLHVRD